MVRVKLLQVGFLLPDLKHDAALNETGASKILVVRSKFNMSIFFVGKTVINAREIFATRLKKE